MKKIKTLAALLVIAALLVLAPGVNKLPVSAEEEREPVTYIIKYIESEGSWRYQSGEGYWRDKVSHRNLYYMKESMRDGDLLVICGSGPELNLEVPVSLNNITFLSSSSVVVTAKSVEDVYVLKNSIGVVNGDVANAFVYDNAIANFNNNVTGLYIREDRDNDQTIAVAGTLDYAEISDKEMISEQFYSFPENTFRMKEGVLKTEPANYSLVPPVVEIPAAEIN